MSILRPLSGIRVIELGGLAPSPFAGLVLADFGADVVRVDRPGASALHTDILGGGRRSLLLDLKRADARDALKRIVQAADVIIEPFRPGVMERLDLGPEVLLGLNPRLVYARLTGWGQPSVHAEAKQDTSVSVSDYKQRSEREPSASDVSVVRQPWYVTAGHDTNYLAMSGALSLFGRFGSAPVPPMNILGDFAAGGFLCAFGVVAALLERSKSGLGQVVDAAIVDGTAYFSAWVAAQAALGLHNPPRGTNLLDTGAPFYECYECASGTGFVSVGAIETQFYAQLLQGLVRGGGLTATEAAALPAQHDRDRWPELRLVFEHAFSTKPRDHWAAVFAGTDACVVPILDLREVSKHPFGAERKLFTKFDESRGGECLRAAPAPRLSRTPAVGSAAGFPAPGSNSKEVLKEYGFSQEEVEALIRSGAVDAGSPIPKPKL